jgi:thioredoxin-like negative regulator of GroEL
MPYKRKKLNVIKIENGKHQDFENKAAHMNGIVLFHHPGCIHCIMLKPKWEMMKKKINGNINIMEVNAEALQTSNSPLKTQITGFPMIVHLNNGKINDTFKEERNIENMLRFVTKYMNEKTNDLDYNYKINKHDNIKKIQKVKNIAKSMNNNNTNNAKKIKKDKKTNTVKKTNKGKKANTVKKVKAKAKAKTGKR